VRQESPMARGISTHRMTDIDPTIVHDETVTVTVIIERGMIDAKETTDATEMIEETGLGGTAPDIVIEGTSPVESILHMLTDDGILLPPIHLAHITVHHVLPSPPILIEKKASEYRPCAYI
jgi:hypothetical protein